MLLGTTETYESGAVPLEPFNLRNFVGSSWARARAMRDQALQARGVTDLSDTASYRLPATRGATSVAGRSVPWALVGAAVLVVVVILALRK